MILCFNIWATRAGVSFFFIAMNVFFFMRGEKIWLKVGIVQINFIFRMGNGLPCSSVFVRSNVWNPMCL